METINQFQYIYDNLTLYSYQFNTDWILSATTMIFGVFIMLVLYYVILLIALKSIGYANDKVMFEKKKIFANLILMKDIQTELEKEIEQAILKAAFHS